MTVRKMSGQCQSFMSGFNAQQSKGYVTQPLRTICVYSTYEVLVIRDTCAIYVIHMCFIRFSFVCVRRCPLRVSADGSFRDFSFELLKTFGRLRFTQFIRILRSLYAILT